MPRTSVVLPDPRSPESVTIMPPRSPGARAPPARSVDSASGRYRCIASIIVASFIVEVCCVAMAVTSSTRQVDLAALARDIGGWGNELGFSEIGIADTGLAADEAR